MAKFLIKDCGATVSVVNNSGQTAVHYCVKNKMDDIALLLVEKGADPTYKDDLGNVAMFMRKDKKLEDKLQKALKKQKTKLPPLLPPSKTIDRQAQPVIDNNRKKSVAEAAAQLVVPSSSSADAKVRRFVCRLTRLLLNCFNRKTPR